MHALRILIRWVVVLATTLCGHAVAAETAQSINIEIDAEHPGRTIPRTLFGSNLQWGSRGDGILDSGGNGFNHSVIAAAKKAGVHALRFPGGALANSYRWKNAVGPANQRLPGRNFGGQNEKSEFGVDEFLNLTDALGAEPIITVNLSAGAAEAADWVEYLNGGAQTTWGQRRTKNGKQQPAKVRYFEIGNEIYSPGEPGYLSAELYARKLNVFADAMHARDPTVRIGAVLEAAFQQADWMRKFNPDLLKWNETVLRLAGKDIDFVAIHFYAPFDKVWLNDDLSRLVWAGPDVFDMTMATLRTLIQRFAKPGLEVALTEYSTFFGDKLAPDLRTTTTENALFDAMILMTAIANPEIVVANHWSLLNNNVFGMWESRAGILKERPFAALFKELAGWSQARVLPVTVSGASYSVSAKGSVPTLSSVLAVRAAAVQRSGGGLQVALVSREPRETQHIRITLKHSQAARFKLAIRTPASGRTEWLPVRLSNVGSIDGRFDFDLPPQSFVMMTEDR
jgi:alpha-N-arabinofuranosidase